LKILQRTHEQARPFPQRNVAKTKNLVKRAKPLDSLYPLASEANIKSPNFPVRLCEIDKIGI
jgi:hypothetical protein